MTIPDHSAKTSVFDQLIAQALAQDFSGWDFSWLRGRWSEQEPPWDYRRLVMERIQQSEAMLDMGTGGGEFLASLPARPAITWATESYPPNIPVAQARLEPLGVQVQPFADDCTLPLPDQSFDLIINRHESYSPAEVYRILKPGGVFLTQQVGSLDCIELNRALDAATPDWSGPGEVGNSVYHEARPLVEAGFQVLRREEALLDTRFHDIGAVVFFLKVIEWQVPDFSVDTYREQLLALHRRIQAEGAFCAQAHRLLVEARKPLFPQEPRS